MDLSRRSFIRWVLGAGAAMACPFPMPAKGEGAGAPAPKLGSEKFTVCHQVRDGDHIPVARPDETRDIVIVGGGPTGLAAAEELKGSDYLLLEKEESLGGNCRTETWEGLTFSTAAAWGSASDPDFARLTQRYKLDWKPIKGEDSVRWDGKWIRDFWNGRADNPAFDQLPYSKSTRDGFKQFLKDIEGLDLSANLERLDSLTFASLLEGYPPELKAFWDAFGPSNYGSRTEDTSGYVGLSVARDWFRDARYTWEGGMAVGSQRQLDLIPESDRKRLLVNAYAYKVKPAGDRVLVSFFQDGKPRTVSARAVVMALPKFIAKYMIEGLPEDQLSAMSALRYAPFPVFNLCFDRVVWNKGYDNWPIGAKHFSDFIPADWATHAEGGDPGRKQVLTVYAPKPEAQRSLLLDDAKAVEMAQAAAQELTDMIPGSAAHLREVRIHRRGHPMPMSIPGRYTRLAPLAARDFGRIYFGHSDARGEISDFFYAALSGIDAAKKAAARL